MSRWPACTSCPLPEPPGVGCGLGKQGPQLVLLRHGNPRTLRQRDLQNLRHAHAMALGGSRMAWVKRALTLVVAGMAAIVRALKSPNLADNNTQNGLYKTNSE